MGALDVPWAVSVPLIFMAVPLLNKADTPGSTVSVTSLCTITLQVATYTVPAVQVPLTSPQTYSTFACTVVVIGPATLLPWSLSATASSRSTCAQRAWSPAAAKVWVAFRVAVAPAVSPGTTQLSVPTVVVTGGLIGSAYQSTAKEPGTLAPRFATPTTMVNGAFAVGVSGSVEIAWITRSGSTSTTCNVTT